MKTCNQLFGLRSDAYVISDDFKPVLSEGAKKVIVEFDGNYKMVQDLEAAIPDGVPSLKNCSKVKVKGLVKFAAGTVLEGDVAITNVTSERVEVSGKITGAKDF